MNQFLDKTFYGNTMLQWAVSLAIIAGAYIFSKLLYWIFKNLIKKATSKTKSDLDDVFFEMIERPIILAVVLAGFWYGIKHLTMPAGFSDFINRIFYIAITFDVSWLIVRLVDSLIQNYLAPLVEKTDSDLDDQLLPIIRKSLKATIWIIAAVVGLNNAGYNVGTIVAGLGLGGLAFAMAAKDSVANLFGGVTVFVDKPFKINDRIIIGGFDGTVKEIGIRSTRLKTLAGRMVTIPNKKFTDSFIENITSEPSRKVSFTLGLTYNASSDNMQRALDILGGIIKENNSTEETYYAGFTVFGAFSLDILFIYYITQGEDILGVQTDINKEILTKFNNENLEFAFPTQTIFSSKA